MKSSCILVFVKLRITSFTAFPQIQVLDFHLAWDGCYYDFIDDNSFNTAAVVMLSRSNQAMVFFFFGFVYLLLVDVELTSPARFFVRDCSVVVNTTRGGSILH